MTVYAILDDQQRVTMWSTSQFAADAKPYEIDDYEHFFSASFCYYLQGNKLVYDDTAKVKAEKEEQIIAQISELKDKLVQSDYQAIKFAEGWITAEDYSITLKQRQSWRDKINELESELR